MCRRDGIRRSSWLNPAVMLVMALMLLLLDGALGSNHLPWSFYHDTASVLDFFKGIQHRHPNLAKYEDVSDPQSGETVPMVTVTDFNTDNAHKDIAVLVFAEHARELITTEVAIWFTRVLLGETEEFLKWSAAETMLAESAQHAEGNAGDIGDWMHHILQNTVFKILPLMNVAGRRKVDSGDFCLRKKLNNVDLNRNYPVAFQRLKATSQEYGGPQPFSEPESRIIRAQVTTGKKPKVYVDVHSGEWALYIPWDSKIKRGEKLPTDTEALLAKMNVHCKCMNGPAGKVAGYLALGSSMDYMYDTAGVPYPLTVEVYGPNGLGTFAAGGHPRHLLQAGIRGNPAHLRCLTEYNPHTLELYQARPAVSSSVEPAGSQDTVAKWVGSFLAIANFLAPYDANTRDTSLDSRMLSVEEAQLPLPLPNAAGALSLIRPSTMERDADTETNGRQAVRPSVDDMRHTKLQDRIRHAVGHYELSVSDEWTTPQYTAGAASIGILAFAAFRVRQRFATSSKRRTV